MKITSSNGHEFQIDESDASIMGSSSWCVHLVKGGKYKYVVNCSHVNGKTKMRFLHRMIAGAETGQMVDHINGDTLDNRRSNLRVCSNRQNQGNQRRVRGVVAYKGVTFENGKYRARIHASGRKVHLGAYQTPEEAAMVYRDAAVKIFGEHAYSNFSE